MQNPVLHGSRSRERVLVEKDSKDKLHKQELEKIRLDNLRMREEAKVRQERQYRTSNANTSAVPEVAKQKKKKIQEEYSMYEEEEKGDDDDELEDIIEENEDESEESDNENKGTKKKKSKADAIKNQQKRDLDSLKT